MTVQTTLEAYYQRELYSAAKWLNLSIHVEVKEYRPGTVSGQFCIADGEQEMNDWKQLPKVSTQPECKYWAMKALLEWSHGSPYGQWAKTHKGAN